MPSSSSSSSSSSSRSSSDSDDDRTPRAKPFACRRPIRDILGGGKVVDVVLWKDIRVSAAIVVGIGIIWYLFEVTGYNNRFMTLLCPVIISAMLIIFMWVKRSSIFKLSGLSKLTKAQLYTDIKCRAGTIRRSDLRAHPVKKVGKALEEEHPVKAFGWAANDPSGVLSPFKFSRRATGDEDVRFKILYCGICHTDLHLAKNEWGMSRYPLLPGHEITGVVTEVGSKVQKYKVGDRVGVGCLVGACHKCDSCKNSLENYCPQQILTYNSLNTDSTMTYGGYSDHMVANERYIVRIPYNLPLDVAAPLLCAGITTYSPLRYFGLDKPGMKVGVVGLGGLGHVAVKLAKAMGTIVTVISTSPRKKQEALEVLGANSFLVSTNPEEMQAAMGTLDGIIDTVSAAHALVPLLFLLKTNGMIIMVGAPAKPLELPTFPLIIGRRIVAGSCIGGLKETQEMIDFAGKHNITPQIEVVPVDYVNTAMERLAKGDVKYRFVLDIGNTLKAT